MSPKAQSTKEKYVCVFIGLLQNSKHLGFKKHHQKTEKTTKLMEAASANPESNKIEYVQNS